MRLLLTGLALVLLLVASGCGGDSGDSGFTNGGSLADAADFDGTFLLRGHPGCGFADSPALVMIARS